MLVGPSGNHEFFLHLRVPETATLKRIGFAYNPTQEAALGCASVASAGARANGIEAWAAPAEETHRHAR